jgi:hypothetical protein
MSLADAVAGRVAVAQRDDLDCLRTRLSDLAGGEEANREDDEVAAETAGIRRFGLDLTPPVFRVSPSTGQASNISSLTDKSAVPSNH